MIYKKNIINILLFILLFSISFPSCIENTSTDNLQVKWSSRNAYNIPYRLRLQKMEEGNLVQNNGFEQGKYYEFNAKSQPFDILNWKKTSDYVEWVDISDGSLYDSTEVNTGSHAVKIVKPLADETEEKGEGVMSEFIRVIPGKYQLRLYLRLDNIKSAKARLGTRLYDAIDIRLIYFDKNKLEINPNIYSRYHKSHINTSFKGYSFSNFNEIDSIGWTEVYCESAYPPFPDGYIPDNARFVKVFIGLKGSGTLWADDIKLHYTADNFSLTEKMAPYFETSHDVYDLLMPAPKSIEKLDALSLKTDNDSMKTKVALVIPKNTVPESTKNLLQSYLEKYSPEVRNEFPDNLGNNYTLIIDVRGKVQKRSNQDSTYTLIEGKGNEAYSLSYGRNEGNIVKVMSNGPDGYFHAFSTLTQLIDTTKDILHKANIIDWPSYKNRNLILPSNDSLPKNLIAFNQMGYNNIFDQRLESEEKYTGAIAKADNLIYRINEIPKSNLSLAPWKNKLRYTNTDNLLLEENIPSEKLLQTGYESLHRILYSKIARADGTMSIFYKPSWNNLYIIDKIRNVTERFIYHNNQYLQQFDSFIWAGNALETSYVDNLDLIRIKDLIPLPISFIQPLFPTSFNGNTLFSLEEFIPIYKGDPTGISNTQFIAPQHQTVVADILIQSAADYLWNPNSYNPTFAMYKALNKAFTRSDAVSLIQYSTLVSQLRKTIIDKEMTHTMHKWTRQEENLILELSSVVSSLLDSPSLNNQVKENVNMTFSILKQYYSGL